jgi:lipopolysaccharide transport system ATP-binding protein
MEDNDVLVKVEHLSKKFCKDLKTSLWYGVKDLYANVRGNKDVRELRPEEFWAVKDINFELRRGECLGLIGHNGAGKSTLLKILNGLINPDEGKVTIKGRVGALIELGAGFNPILSGRENIYNNGAVLGFTKKEIDSKVEDIIDFAEIREFIDMPVQNYSSGMKVRLGFAVAAQMEPDVLIIDEVLAVGDVAFRMKCYNTITSLMKNTAIIFVSHSMPQVSKICTSAILLNRGEIKINSHNVSDVINKYFFEARIDKKANVTGSGEANVLKKTIYTDNQSSEEELPIEKGEKFCLELKLKVNAEIKKYIINFIIYDMEMKGLLEFSSLDEGLVFINNGEPSTYKVELENILNTGDYSILLHVLEFVEDNRMGNICLRYENFFTFKSYSKNKSFESYIPYTSESKWEKILD